jgi:VWFA-related protein
LLALALPAVLLAQEQPGQELPRFRAGANLVRVDAYVSKDDVALTNLTVADFEVYEDDKPQKIENFELVKARPPIPQSERTDPNNTRDMRQQVQDAARVFTLFFDRLYVSLAGSYHTRKPLIETLDKVIGPDDLIGVMTPEMSPGAITYGRKTISIERAVTDTWYWGMKDQIAYRHPTEDAINDCYPPNVPEYRGLAAEMIARLREQQTLDALDALITHLDGLRPERKFVMVFTEGWPLFRANDKLARKSGKDQVPGTDPVSVNPVTGGLTRQGDPDPRSGQVMGFEGCERLRNQLAFVDHEMDFREMLQRANRANVSFYPIDARGLIVFDTPIEWGVPPTLDAAWLRKRHDDLRTMALQTDGEAILDVGDIGRAMQKVFADVGSYYLLSYYSTNQKLDGRFRRIRVDVRRDDVQVRARPGYLAPTEAEARAASTITRTSARTAPPPTVTRALDAVAPARGFLPVRIQAVGGNGTIRAVVELDVATAKKPEWISGGTLRLTIEPERIFGAGDPGPSQTVTVAVDPGQRSIVVPASERPLAAGRYSVRAELTPRGSRMPIQVTTIATVPAEAVEVGTGALALRRGPSTGLVYEPTADPRFRRTERLRIEVPLMGDDITGTGRLLTSAGQAMALVVTYSTRTDDETKQRFGMAEVVLSPLAAGEYVLELSLAKGGKTDVVTYGFRLIP